MTKLLSINRNKQGSFGFTLVELLVVVGIISLLTALILPAFNSLVHSQNLTHAANMVSDSLVSARQSALTQNRMVEVRFYKLPTENGGSLEFRALRLMKYDETGEKASPLSKLQRFPVGVILSSDALYSSLLSNANINPPSATNTDPDVNGAVYKAILFTTSGSSPLELTTKWFLSIQLENAAPAAGKPADNFATVQLDPVNGRIRRYRP